MTWVLGIALCLSILALIASVRAAAPRWPNLRPWLRWLLLLLFMLAFEGVAWLAIYVVGGRTPWKTPLGVAVANTTTFVFLTLALIAFVQRVVFALPWRPLSVARAVMSEAVATRVVLGAVGLLLLFVSIMPFLGADEPVRYRVQTYLTYSGIAIHVVLGLATVIFASWTLANEVTDKQIFTVATKPIDRGSYLLGKWIGLVAFNTIVLVVVGGAVYSFTVLYLARQRPHNIIDAVELNERVLVARVSVEPRPPEPFEIQAERQLAELERIDPRTIDQLGEAAAEERGLSAAGPDKIKQLGRETAFFQLLDAATKQWMSVGPQETQTYIFEGLANAKDYGRAVQWRYKALVTPSPPGDTLNLVVGFNKQATAQALTFGSAQEVPVPVEWVGPDGRMVVDVRHFDPFAGAAFPATVSFRAEEMRMLFQVGSFGPNYFRGMIVVWLKLAFLSMLGLMAATFLSFPVACLLGLLVFGGAVISPFLMASLSAFGGTDTGVVAVFKGVTGFVAMVIGSTLGAWGTYSPGAKIADGLFVSWRHVAGAALWLGVIWTGSAALIAWITFRRRELARVQV